MVMFIFTLTIFSLWALAITGVLTGKVLRGAAAVRACENRRVPAPYRGDLRPAEEQIEASPGKSVKEEIMGTNYQKLQERTTELGKEERRVNLVAELAGRGYNLKVNAPGDYVIPVIVYPEYGGGRSMEVSYLLGIMEIARRYGMEGKIYARGDGWLEVQLTPEERD